MLKGLRNTDSAETHAAALELCRLVLTHGKSVDTTWSTSDPSPWWPPLVSAIEADGWEFDAEVDTLVPAVPGITVAEETGWLVDQLVSRNMNDAAGHYDQAIEAFAAGRWASANAQLRSFFEALIPELAALPTTNRSGRVHRGFDKLEADGHLLDNESDFGKSLWKMLHPNGSHPGLSDHDEARFRLLALTGYARFLLPRCPD